MSTSGDISTRSQVLILLLQVHNGLGQLRVLLTLVDSPSVGGTYVIDMQKTAVNGVYSSRVDIKIFTSSTNQGCPPADSSPPVPSASGRRSSSVSPVGRSSPVAGRLALLIPSRGEMAVKWGGYHLSSKLGVFLRSIKAIGVYNPGIT